MRAGRERPSESEGGSEGGTDGGSKKPRENPRQSLSLPPLFRVSTLPLWPVARAAGGAPLGISTLYWRKPGPAGQADSVHVDSEQGCCCGGAPLLISILCWQQTPPYTLHPVSRV